jgi:hypothetical protein
MPRPLTPTASGRRRIRGARTSGLPTPGGFCLTADAYRAQIAAWSRRLGAPLREGGSVQQRGSPSKSGLALRAAGGGRQSQPLLAWRGATQRERRPSAVRSSALSRTGRAAISPATESFLGIAEEAAFLTAVRLLGRADHQCAAPRGKPRSVAGRYRDGSADQPLIDARPGGGERTAEGRC